MMDGVWLLDTHGRLLMEVPLGALSGAVSEFFYRTPENGYLYRDVALACFWDTQGRARAYMLATPVPAGVGLMAMSGQDWMAWRAAQVSGIDSLLPATPADPTPLGIVPPEGERRPTAWSSIVRRKAPPSMVVVSVEVLDRVRAYDQVRDQRDVQSYLIRGPYGVRHMAVELAGCELDAGRYLAMAPGMGEVGTFVPAPPEDADVIPRWVG